VYVCYAFTGFDDARATFLLTIKYCCMKKLCALAACFLLCAVFCNAFAAPLPTKGFGKAGSKMLANDLWVYNYWYANVDITSMALGDPSNVSFNSNVPSGNSTYVSFTGSNGYGPLYVTVNVLGLPEDPAGKIALYYSDALGSQCQEITGSGTYVFYNVALISHNAGLLTVDWGPCN
jgi:hypothetical protein